jgi:GNAT superfamily N-acetyltransferase
MANLIIRDMEEEDEQYVGTCSHVNESDEIDACARRRLLWLKAMYHQGLRVKVALLEGKQIVLLYLVPIEFSQWGPMGEDLMVIPCLFVTEEAKHKGIGRALLEEAEEETKRQGRKGLVTIAYTHDFWFMPAGFFETCGFSAVKSRGQEVLLWKVFDETAKAPEFLERKYRYEPIRGKVVVDLFWNTFCQTSVIEARRVREVAAEFGEHVVLHEYPADDHEILLRLQTPRGIFVNGKEIWWGYEAPKEGIREAISQALEENG